MAGKANPAGFVASVIRRVQTDTTADKAFRAVMRRADNPAFESAAWEYLIPYCNIENDFERIPFAVIGAAIAKSKPVANGDRQLGAAFSHICEKKEDRERESRRFRRLISCDSALELCVILRPVLQYLAGKGAAVDFVQLLNDLLYWNQKIRIRWARQFYRPDGENREIEA